MTAAPPGDVQDFDVAPEARRAGRGGRHNRSSRLQRERNLEADPRAALLVEHWHRDDWSLLWWVPAELRWQEDAAAARAADLAARLARAFPQYRDEPFTRVLVLRVVAVTGWAAGVQ